MNIGPYDCRVCGYPLAGGQCANLCDPATLPPAPTSQMLSDARINPFAVELLTESFLRAGGDREPFEFRFNGVGITLRVVAPAEVPERLTKGGANP